MPAQRWYLLNVDAPYAPATWHGSWGSHPASTSFTKTIDPVKWALNSNQTSSPTAYTGTGPHTLGMRRLISRRLAAQTIAGTVDMVAAVVETSAASDWYTRLYIWVTQGDSDVARGVLLDYTEAAGVGGATEWPTTRTGKALAAAQALSSVVVSAGDRLVVEFGGSRGTTASGTYNGSVEVGAWGFSGAAYADLAVAETPTTSRAGYLTFSAEIALSSAEASNLSPTTATAMTTFPYNASIVPAFPSQEIWFQYTATERGGLGLFAGRGAADTYTPSVEVYTNLAGAVTFFLATGTSGQVLSVPLTVGTVYAIRVLDYNTPTAYTGTLIWQARTLLGLPSDLNGYLLVPADFVSAASGTVVIDPATGVVVGLLANFPPGETGAVISGANRLLVPDKSNTTILWLYSTVDLTVVGSSITGVLAAGQVNPPIAASADTFYVGQYRTDIAGWRLTAVSSAGVAGATWTLTFPGGTPTAMNDMGVQWGNRIAYYDRSELNEPVRAWDLVNNVALPNLVAGQATFRPNDIQVLRDDTVLVHYDSAFGASPQKIERYNASGTLLNTYLPLSLPGYAAYTIDHIRIAADNPASFWVWLQNFSGGLGAYAFVRYRVSDGAVLANLTANEFNDGHTGPIIAAGATPTTFFGAPNSCPLLVLLVETTAEPTYRTVETRRMRRAPHLSNENQWTFHERLTIDLEAGVGLSSGQGSEPQVMVRWSDDGGHTWSREHWRTAGRMGETRCRVIWRRLGRSRDRVYEMVVSDPVAWHIVGAYLVATPGGH